jgi:hypothetical protein
VSFSSGSSRGRRPDRDRARPARGRPDPARGEPGRRPAGSDPGLAVQIGLPALAFALAVGVAELVGAANLGVAFGVGQVAFIVVLVAVLMRRPG